MKPHIYSLFFLAIAATITTTIASPAIAQTTFNSDKNSVSSPDKVSSAGKSGYSTMYNSNTGQAAQRAANSKMPENSSYNWESENAYWRSNFPSRPYSSGGQYSNYEPAYRYGVELYKLNRDKSYDQLDQPQVRAGWEQNRAGSTLNWSDAQQATRDAYNRLYENRQRSTTSSSSGSTGTGGSSGIGISGGGY